MDSFTRYNNLSPFHGLRTTLAIEDIRTSQDNLFGSISG